MSAKSATRVATGALKTAELPVTPDAFTAHPADASIATQSSTGAIMKGIYIFAIALTACATQAQVDGDRDARGDCVRKHVALLDDGKSDPISIAYGVAPSCASLYNELTQDMVHQNITEGGQAAMRERMRDGEIRLITAAVLAHRAKRG